MKNWRQDINYFFEKKSYWLAIILTSVGSYGYLITHAAIGIDDTPYRMYFSEGLSAFVGRWVIYALGKILRIAEYAPFLTDLVGVILLAASAFVFGVLMRHILKDTVPYYGYLFFSCFLVANPIWSEVFIYFLHNGVGLGYLLLGISLCLSAYAREQDKKAYLFSALFLWLSVGCYESMMVAWLVGYLLVLLAERYMGREQKLLRELSVGAGVMIGAMALRTVWLPVLKWAFQLNRLGEIAGTRSLSELGGWIADADGRADFVMALKRAYVMYGAFAYAYYPILLFVLAAFVLLCSGIVHSIRKREGWTVFLTVAALGSCFLLIPIEGKVTLYRSAQFLPLVSAFGVLLLGRGIEVCLSVWSEKKAEKGSGGTKRGYFIKAVRGAAAIIFAVMLYNQCADMNRWFYIDNLKYQAAKETAGQISYELRKGYDLSKPVIFTGIYEIPPAIVQDAYVPYNSPVFYKINRLTNIVDPHLLEKFYRSQGVWVAQAPTLSVIGWGMTAFDNNQELVNFFAMHGYSLLPMTDWETICAAQSYAVEEGLPRFPEQGSIVDAGQYLIVNF